MTMLLTKLALDDDVLPGRPAGAGSVDGSRRRRGATGGVLEQIAGWTPPGLDSAAVRRCGVVSTQAMARPAKPPRSPERQSQPSAPRCPTVSSSAMSSMKMSAPLRRAPGDPKLPERLRVELGAPALGKRRRSGSPPCATCRRRSPWRSARPAPMCGAIVLVAAVPEEHADRGFVATRDLPSTRIWNVKAVGVMSMPAFSWYQPNRFQHSPCRETRSCRRAA